MNKKSPAYSKEKKPRQCTFEPMQSIEVIIIYRNEILDEFREKCDPIYRNARTFNDDIYDTGIFQQLLDNVIFGQLSYPVRQQLISIAAQVSDVTYVNLREPPPRMGQ